LITYYYRRAEAANETKIMKDFHLEKEQYLQGKVDWLVKDAKAWDSLCEWWASPDFRARSDRDRMNRISKRVVHHYSANGHIRKVQRTV
jgi:hypothetical protein